MKTYCKTCTIHFIDEFEKTLETPCNYWGDIGMTNIPVDVKKKLWDWIFSLPADELPMKYKIGITYRSSQPV